MRMDARRSTKVVVRTTNRGDRQSRRRILAPTLWDGADRGAGFVATAAASRLNVRKLTLAFAETGFSLGLQIVAYYLLRLASRHHPRPATRRARVGLIQRFLRLSPWSRRAPIMPRRAYV